MPAPALNSAIVLLYLTAAAPGLLALRGRWRWPLDPRIVMVLPAALGAGLQLWSLAGTLVTPDGVSLGLTAVLALFAWQVVVLLILASLRWPLHHLSVVVLPLAAASVVLWVLNPGDADTSALGGKLASHVALSTLAYGTLALAALQAMAYAWLDRSLHRAGPPSSIELPPLELMETVLFRLIGIGLGALSLALISGALFIENLFAQHLVHKTVLSVAAWLLLSTLVWGRILRGWRGRRVVRIMLSGFVLLVLAYFGSRTVLEVVLDRSWS